jgi:hypothetical protein
MASDNSSALAPRLARRRSDAIDIAPITEWWDELHLDASDEPEGPYGVTIECLTEPPQPTFALVICCLDAVRQHAGSDAALAAELEKGLAGARLFAQDVRGRVRSIGGLPGLEFHHRKDDRFERSIGLHSAGLHWHAFATSTDPERTAAAIMLAERSILPQFLETT